MTPRERRAHKRKQEILQAALEVLSEDGYTRASMDKIAERAMLTRVGLYQHFSDKAKLMTALREFKLLELAQIARQTTQEITGFEAKIRAIVQRVVQYQHENTGFFHVLLSSSFSGDLNADLSLKPFLYSVAEVFAQGINEGRIRQEDPLEYAGLLAIMVFSPSIKRAFTPLSDEQLLTTSQTDLIADVLLRGVLLE